MFSGTEQDFAFESPVETTVLIACLGIKGRLGGMHILRVLSP